MKCIKKDEVVKRVSNEIAALMVAEKGWSYSSKGAWKRTVRDAAKPKKVEPVVEAPVAVEAMAEKPKRVRKPKKVEA